MSQKEKNIREKSAEIEASLEKLRGDAGELITDLKIAIFSIPQFRAQLGNAFFSTDGASAMCLTEMDGTNYIVTYKRTDNMNGLYESIAIGASTKPQEYGDMLENIVVIAQKNPKSKNIEHAHVTYSKSSVSQGINETGENNELAIKGVKGFIQNLISSPVPVGSESA